MAKTMNSSAKRKPAAAPKSAAAEKFKKSAAAKSAGKKTKAATAEVKKKVEAAETAAGKPAAKRKSGATKTTAAKKASSPKKSASEKPAAKSAAKAAKKTAPGKKIKKTADEPLPAAVFTAHIADPIGDTTDGEAGRLLADSDFPSASVDSSRADAGSNPEQEAAKAEDVAQFTRAEDKPETGPESGPEPHLERLQKILSQAGIASRRHAEEMIVAGRVMVNGQVITQLGAKADPARDHVRVDGKLIQGAERRRTFVLNKPKGYVTTVSDPEGRPTVMQFFEKMRERLYPVGRLDYQSEGLLLMTNDGELANGLTRAAAGVEKTYLVKVAGRPSDEEIEQLRAGISIDREQPGEGRVRTAPAVIRQVRQGENPWYEVVLTEGRNRELRKMFQAVGHFVEKIRRVGYGPLVLDVEPGQFRELSVEEVNTLRLTADGKLKPRRPKSSAMLPREAGHSAEARQERGLRSEFRREVRASGREFGRGKSSRDSERRFASRPQRGEGRPFRGREPESRGQAGFEQGEGQQRGRFEPRRLGGGHDRASHSERAQGDQDAGRFERREGGFKREGGFNRFGTRGRSEPQRFGDRGKRFGERPQRREETPQRFDGTRQPRGEFRGGPPRFDKSERFGQPERGERKPRPDSRPTRGFRPREEARRGQPGGFGAPRFKPRTEPRFDREHDGGETRAEARPTSAEGRPNRPQRFDRTGRPGESARGGRPGFGSRPSGFRKPGFGGKPDFRGKPRFGGKPGGRPGSGGPGRDRG